MPIQVLPGVQRGPTIGQKFSQAIGTGLEMGGQMLQEREQQKMMHQENEAAKKLGVDLSGINNPALRKEALSYALQGKNQLELEREKQSGEQKQQQQKQTFLQNLLNNGKSQNQPGKNTNKNIEKEDENLGFDASQISDEDILTAEAMGFKGLRDAKDAALKATNQKTVEERRQYESDRDFNTKRSDPVIQEAQGILKTIPITKGLINQQRRDIASGETAGLMPFLVDKLGLEAYRNPESARFKTASKQRFVESLNEIGGAGARPNQFIEQQLVSAQPAIGRDAESNQTILDLEEFVNDMKEKRAQIIQDLADSDEQKLGYAKADINSRADKLMKDYAEKRQDQMAYSIRNRHEEKLSDDQLIQELVSKKVPTDTPLTLRSARILMIKNNDDEKKATQEAKKLGFKIPKE